MTLKVAKEIGKSFCSPYREYRGLLDWACIYENQETITARVAESFAPGYYSPEVAVVRIENYSLCPSRGNTISRLGISVVDWFSDG